MRARWVLQGFDLGQIHGELEEIKYNTYKNSGKKEEHNFNIEVPDDHSEERLQIHFAQEGNNLGSKMILTDHDIQEMDRKRIDFLKDQFIIIVDNKKIEEVKIMSMKNLDHSLT